MLIKFLVATRDPKLALYVKQVKRLLAAFGSYHIESIPRDRNAKADALAKHASSRDVREFNFISVKILKELLDGTEARESNIML